MNKRITSILLCFIMLFSMLVSAVPVYAATYESTQLKVVPDKTTANPGDIITYTIVMGPVSDMGSMQMVLDIPTGLTYVENSGKLADGLRTALGFDAADWTEVSKMVNGYASAADYECDTDTTLATFQCKVNDGFTGTVSVGLKNLEFGSCQTFEYHTNRFSVVPTAVAIEAKPVAVTGVTIDETLSVKTGESKTPSYTVNPAEATNKAVSFKSDNTAVATVNETTGEVTGVKEGTATITITTADGNFTDTCVVTVACSHANKTPVAEKASDCKNQGWDAYVKCDDCGQLFKADGTTELWANGTYPTNANYNKANVPMVAAGQTYNIGENTDLAIAMKANLSLSANLKLNVYVPTSTDLKAISICGVIYDIYAAPVVEINGGKYYYFGYEIAPHFATGDFTVVATVGDVTIAKAIDLIEYADLVDKQYKDDAAAINLAKAVLTYVSAAAKHMGAYTQGYDASNAYADAAAIAVDTSSAVNTMANVNSYITAAALDLNAAPAWVFYVANGADISDLVIKVNGRAVNYNVVGNTVVVELRAYDMLETLTVEVGGVSAQYNFAAYYTAIKATNDAFTWPGNWQAGDNNDGAIAYHSMQLLDAFYSYAVYAAAVQ